MDMDTLKAECLACTRCELCATRTNVVFGQGVPDAEVLFVGEGPGQSEDEQGLPFVGRSGQLLDKYLFAIDLDRNQNCYIANIVKCRPPQNRDPLPAESEACMPWLREQFRLIQPKIVGDSMGLPPLTTLFFLFLGYRLRGLAGMILAVPVGLIFIKFYEYGAFDSLINSVKELAREIEEIRHGDGKEP